MSGRENIFLCDGCVKERDNCDVAEALKGLFRVYSQRYDIHGFFAITQCQHFISIKKENEPLIQCAHGNCELT